MNQRFIPITGIDCLISCLFIDKNAPLDVLHANGAARLLAVTQLLESLSRAELKNADDTDLQHISNVAAILLRDSCDLLGVMGWRLQA
ncbi:short-chain dehydrogenase [Pseudomonas sp. Au-Pse12]|uniref:short-chain dehydrogenase n=1 Tax=Pseudomonas sp. Au-Pse12 TaxID=2906459 RepID=UPI001E40949D|nr:short-chain dehydrogenase [Pseudomonas sp. Au-Pse12]MCE4053053.1 short-chain dehydrogenase [Pseudomonas sp. Au-Pse12]